MRGYDRERDGVSPNFCLLLSVLVLSYCLQFLLPNKSDFRNHLSFIWILDFLPLPLSPVTVRKRGNLCFVFSLFLFFLSVPAGGCGIWACCLLGKCAARLTQHAVLLFPVLVALLWTVLSELLGWYEEPQVLCVLDVHGMSDWSWRVWAQDC